VRTVVVGTAAGLARGRTNCLVVLRLFRGGCVTRTGGATGKLDTSIGGFVERGNALDVVAAAGIAAGDGGAGGAGTKLSTAGDGAPAEPMDAWRGARTKKRPTMIAALRATTCPHHDDNGERRPEPPRVLESAIPSVFVRGRSIRRRGGSGQGTRAIGTGVSVSSSSGPELSIHAGRALVGAARCEVGRLMSTFVSSLEVITFLHIGAVSRHDPFDWRRGANPTKWVKSPGTTALRSERRGRLSAQLVQARVCARRQQALRVQRHELL
jgi:hypothetical protein